MTSDDTPAESGRLRDLPMPELLWQLHMGRRTGCLHVRKGTIEKRLWLLEGRPVFARSNEAGDRLTDRLLARGLLSRAQYDQAQDLIAAGSGKRIGQVLLAAGLIREPELHEALSEQLLRMLESMFLWSDARWTFEADVVTAEPVTLDLPTAAIVMGGARHRIPLKRLWAAVGGPELCPRLPLEDRAAEAREALAQALRLVPSEAAWLAALDGTRPLRELLADFSADEHELLALLYTLKLIGRLELVPAAPQPIALQR